MISVKAILVFANLSTPRRALATLGFHGYINNETVLDHVKLSYISQKNVTNMKITFSILFIEFRYFSLDIKLVFSIYKFVHVVIFRNFYLKRDKCIQALKREKIKKNSLKYKKCKHEQTL